LWDRLHALFRSFDGAHKMERHRGPLSRPVTSPYLFSGLLKCGEIRLPVAIGIARDRDLGCFTALLRYKSSWLAAGLTSGIWLGAPSA